MTSALEPHRSQLIWIGCAIRVSPVKNANQVASRLFKLEFASPGAHYFHALPQENWSGTA
jgi:hypothetical protein